MPSTPDLAGSRPQTTVHRPRMFFWIQIGLVALLFGVAAFLVFVAGTHWPWISATGVLNSVLAVFLLLTAIGSRRLHVTLSEGGVEFTLPRPGNATLLPWMLLHAKVGWTGIHAVDVRERNVILNKTCYILRTDAGDAFFFAPSWCNAQQLAEEIMQRSGSTISYEDLLAAPPMGPSTLMASSTPSLAEKAAHAVGIVFAIIVGILAMLLLIAAYVAGPEERTSIWFALFLLWIPATGATALMRFRRMR